MCVRERERRAEQVDKLGWKPRVVNIVQCDRGFLASLLTQEKSRIMRICHPGRQRSHNCTYSSGKSFIPEG